MLERFDLNAPDNGDLDFVDRLFAHHEISNETRAKAAIAIVTAFFATAVGIAFVSDGPNPDNTLPAQHCKVGDGQSTKYLEQQSSNC